MGSIHVAILLE